MPPDGFSGTAALSGQALLFGATASTGGDGTVTVVGSAVRPTLRIVKAAPGLFGVSVTGEIGRLFRVDATENLGSGAWTPLVTISLTQSPFTFVDLDSTTNPKRFYRLTLLQ